ncbi:MAG TPA: radical SAM protein [Nostocaceae cyanobacterium]|nr:radical SAM protein [Nostocaceae cyanobacterium]
MAPTGKTNRIVQIHPSRRCNLRCLHCYSSSSPEERDQLSVTLLLQAIIEASQQGYTVASFSGGEPLMYEHLPELLKQAHKSQMQTTVTTNGILLDEKHLEKLEGIVDAIAISLDGMPATHNKIRSSPQAFEKMSSRLSGLRESGIPFGFIVTFTKQNFRELEWVANFALEQGAKLLQIHCLAEVGHASQNLVGLRPGTDILSFVYLKAMGLQKALGHQMVIQIDLVHQEILRACPEAFFVGESAITDLISPLIIEADGTIVPIQYGFARNYALGNLQQASLNELFTRWYQESHPSFLQLCQRVYNDLTAPAELPIVDWYEALTKESQLKV